MHPIKKTLAIVALASSALAFAPAALASGPVVEVRSRVVSYGDLDLGTRAGDQTLLKRIDHAATKACGGFPGGPDPAPYKRFDQCRAEAMDNAVHDVGNVAVSRLYDREVLTQRG